jgi:AraC family transcriptional regulator, transcriptional activator of the genes for pyochelin and ferripyochelin receptors
MNTIFSTQTGATLVVSYANRRNAYARRKTDRYVNLWVTCGLHHIMMEDVEHIGNPAVNTRIPKNMSQFKTLNFNNVCELSTHVKDGDDPALDQYRIVKKAAGVLETRELKHDMATVIEYWADGSDNFRIQYDDARMLNHVNICFTMEGHVGIQFPESKFKTSLADFQHHHIFAPDPRYDLLVSKHVKGFHLAIDRAYYAGLLCEQDNRTRKLKDDLHHQRMTWSGSRSVTAAMHQSLSDIFNNPLSGKLKSVFVEAKILELIALQLDHSTDHTRATKRSDVDLFHDIKKFLEQHFKDDLSLRGIARTFGLNEFKLKSGFKLQFRTTIFDYIHDLRMIHANVLLRDDKMFVNEVSAIVGYKNPNHFSTAFKRRFGVSPSSIK